MEAPDLARDYYELPEHASMRDMILAIRADESIHRDLNHKFSEILMNPLTPDQKPINCE